jgi:hypothetical protein
MREITQWRAATYRMVGLRRASDDHLKGGEPMRLLRASAVALPFVGLAILVGVLSVVIGLAR